jgi:hypothetical protein
MILDDCFLCENYFCTMCEMCEFSIYCCFDFDYGLVPRFALLANYNAMTVRQKSTASSVRLSSTRCLQGPLVKEAGEFFDDIGCD